MGGAEAGGRRMSWEGWHFLADSDRVVRTGEWVVAGLVLSLPEGEEPVLCQRGFHASKRCLDALRYAPGPVVERVRLGGRIVEDTDKAVGQTRETLWVADATRVLREFACWSAEKALRGERAAEREPDARSWAAVEAKRAWLAGEIGDAARAAALAAAEAAADDAARAAALAGAGAGVGTATDVAATSAAGAAAWAAFEAVACDGAWAAAWAADAAARAAAWAAGYDAAWAAVGAAVGAVARAVGYDAGAVARTAAYDAARVGLDAELERLLRALAPGTR